jgi:RimJ/RimL family protein N-acetyltransferase
MTAGQWHEPVVPRRLSTDPVERMPPACLPVRTVLTGRTARLEPLDPDRHGPGLFRASHGEGEEALWRYLSQAPFPDEAAMRPWLLRSAASADPMFFAICAPDGTPLGMASYLNIRPEAGSIEIGHILFGFALQRTAAATEAIYLMVRHAMMQGYRRVEWKCDAANLPSRRAAGRFGFRHEGVFYRALVVKGRNRDTAWYSLIDEEWPPIQTAFEAWLAPGNFDTEGRQHRSLASFRQDTSAR